MRVVTRFNVIAMAVFMALITSACGGAAAPSGGGGGAAAGDPTAATKSFFDAVFSGGDINPYLCTTNAASAKAISQGMDSMKTALAASGAKIDTSGLKYEAGAASGDTTPVKVSGKLKTSVGGVSTDSDYPAATIMMKNESGSWKVCG